MGTAGQFIYDLNCIRHARKSDFDVILFMGYTSSSVWGRLFPRNTVIISNMDGMEWKRSKYTGQVKRFLLYAEKLAAKYSHHLIADSMAVKHYLDKKYKASCTYIPYGAIAEAGIQDDYLKRFSVSAQQYYMLMARMEPENNIDMILEGFSKTVTQEKFLVVGNTANAFGKKMQARYSDDRRIVFAGALFDAAAINALRRFSKLYFHGHSVGGTNPSLLEAMACLAPIAAHNNEFNRAVLQQDAFYFSNADEVAALINQYNTPEQTASMIRENEKKIRKTFNWPAVIDTYENTIIDCYHTYKR